MLLLAFDTAGPDCAVALARGDAHELEILVRSSERIHRGHAERLMPMVEAALGEARLAFDDLHRIAVTVGPGSFTGVRVGIAAARALAMALEIPAAGVGSLDAMAFEVMRSEFQGTVVAALDAKRGEIYALARDLASSTPLVQPKAMRVEGLISMLERAPRPLLLTGSGAPILAASLDPTDFRVAGLADAPDIASVALLGLKGDASDKPVPLYLRGADAKPQFDKAVAQA